MLSMDKARAKKYTAAARRALEAFPVNPGPDNAGKVELVWESENITFRITDADTGARYVLRLHRHDYHSINGLNSERAWTQALGQAGLEVPVAVPTRSGEHFHRLELPGEPDRFAGMTLWMEGTPMVGLVDANPADPAHIERFKQIGTLAARLHNQSVAWPVPTGFERPPMDADGLLGEAPIWGRFWEHTDLTGIQRDQILSLRERLRDLLKSYGQSGESFGLIHADLHTENILTIETGIAPIDFDDSGFGWHMYDLAVVLFAERDKPQFAQFRDAVIEGYRLRRELSPRDLAMLPAFILIRALVLIGWVEQRPEVDNDGYFEQLRDLVCAASADFRAPF
jgi:Ser/Thr protein kinase RdoA (MazF antagonist)